MVQGFFPGGKPRIIQASPAPSPPVRPPAPARLLGRPGHGSGQPVDDWILEAFPEVDFTAAGKRRSGSSVCETQSRSPGRQPLTWAKQTLPAGNEKEA